MKHLIAAAAVVLSATGVMAQDFEAGIRAFEASDYATAPKEWTPLAERGDVEAQFKLGQMYDYGTEDLQDNAEAARWYRLAAEQGNQFAQFNLGWLYEVGEGVLQDYAEAVRWYRLAAEQGHMSAQNNLGEMYLNGYGVLQSNLSAHMWFNISASQGKTHAKKARDKIAENMTPADISEAQRRAKACLASNYQDCD